MQKDGKVFAVDVVSHNHPEIVSAFADELRECPLCHIQTILCNSERCFATFTSPSCDVETMILRLYISCGGCEDNGYGIFGYLH